MKTPLWIGSASWKYPSWKELVYEGGRLSGSKPYSASSDRIEREWSGGEGANGTAWRGK